MPQLLWHRAPAGEERPGFRGNYPVTTPCHFPGRSALRHAGYAVGSRADGNRRGPGPGRARWGGAAAQAGRPGRADRRPGGSAGAEGEVPPGGPRCSAGVHGGGDRAGRHQHDRYHRAGPSRPGPGYRAERHDGAADAGAGRSGHPGQGRPGPGPGPRARLVADRGEAGRVPVAGHRREGAGGLAGHRPGRHADHRAQRQGRSRSHVQDGLRLPPARGLAVPIPPSHWRCCCGRATPDRTPSPTTSPC